MGDHTCATYTFDGEDHTLGNLLRYALIKNPEVEFCGYSITHPSEHTINMRLQTTGSGTNGVMAQGLNSINFMVDVAERKFTEALERKRATDKQRKTKAQ
jgi:DNA-directed RNA polymerase I and III subunit RPAC2